jgi:site-specific DNA-methyltransferase (adenine-specific)
VLDPFAGSGTTCLVAAADKRHYIGYEIDPSYVELARERISAIKS